jgi:glycosyltransferase involved in cell wall biosynthesis
MRIVIDGLSACIGGGVTYLLNLLPELGRVGARHSFVVLLRRELSERVRRGALPPNVSLVPVPVSSLVHRVVLEQAWLPRVLRRSRADLVYGPAELVPLASRCPAVVGCQNPNLYTDRDIGWPPALRRRFAVFRLLAIASIRRSRRVISASEAWRGAIARTSGIATDRIAVIPHGVPPRFRALGQARTAGTTATGTRGSWLSVSTIYRYKNYETLVESVRRLRERGAPVQVAIVGGDADPDHHRRLRARIDACGLGDRVRLLGAVEYDAVQRFYAAAAGFVFPSWLETFGHPLLEAMAAGVPLVAADIPVFREIAGDGALYADPFDADALAAAMATVEEDPEGSARRARRAFERSGEFTWERTAVRTLEAFEQAAA